MGPRERERRLANQRIDRSHRRGRVHRSGHRPSRTMGEKIMLVLSFALIGTGVVLAVVAFLL